MKVYILSYPGFFYISDKIPTKIANGDGWNAPRGDYIDFTVGQDTHPNDMLLYLALHCPVHKVLYSLELPD